jgi:hypothetical protein
MSSSKSEGFRHLVFSPVSKVNVLMLYDSFKPVDLQSKGHLIEMQPLLDEGLSCLSLTTIDDETVLVGNVQRRTLCRLTRKENRHPTRSDMHWHLDGGIPREF